VVQWLALLLHNKKIVGWNLAWSLVCMFSPCLSGFSLTVYGYDVKLIGNSKLTVGMGIHSILGM